MDGKPNDEKKNNVFKPNAAGIVLAAVVLVLIAVIVVLVVILLKTGSAGDNNGDNGPEVIVTSTDAPNDPVTTTVTEPAGGTDPVTEVTTTTKKSGQSDPEGVTTGEVQMDNSKVYTGALILVDADHPYMKDKTKLLTRTEMGKLSAGQLLSEYNFRNIYGTTGGNYSVRGATGYYLDSDALNALNSMMAVFAEETGHNDVQVRNAYYYDASEEVCINATGLVVDLQIYTKDGKVYPLKYDPKKAEYYDWLVDNCYKYGYIHIGDSKSSSGEELYSSFRYVGEAHAACMATKGLTHDAYIELIKGYRYENRLTFTADNTEWWVYYVPGSGIETTVKVIGNSYTILGNNIDGFVVAINASQLGK